MAQKTRRRDRAREPVHVTHFAEKVFCEWPLKTGETMRVTIDNFKGHDLVHVQRWQRGPNGRLYPTEKGTAIGIGQLPRVIKALRAVREHARAIGLLPPRLRPR